MDIEKSIRENLLKQKEQINDIFGLTFDEIKDEIIKAKAAQMGEIRTWSGVKMRKEANGWVPVKEGGAKQPTQETGGEKKPQAEGEAKQTPANVDEAAKQVSEAALQNAIKQSPDPEVREAAHKELKRRQGEEAGEMLKKPEGDKPAEEPKKEEAKSGGQSREEKYLSDKRKELIKRMKGSNPKDKTPEGLRDIKKQMGDLQAEYEAFKKKSAESKGEEAKPVEKKEPEKKPVEAKKEQPKEEKKGELLEADKEYFKQNRDAIMKDLMDDPLLSVNDAIADHKKNSKVGDKTSRRETDFFESKHGGAIKKLLGDKFDGDKITSYLDNLAPDEPVRWGRIMDSVANRLGIDHRKFANYAKLIKDGILPKIKEFYSDKK